MVDRCRIKQLPDLVANQIAAGEVIERPASVIKELVENSIDAGATKIDVVIIDSGKTLMQVVDNGIGMSLEDAKNCFVRHATSKLSSIDDLDSLATMGFRGEALASIAAVSDVTLTTKIEGADLANRLSVKGVSIPTIEQVVAPEGSNFEVRNIFFNTPGRRRFLKSDNAEFSHIVTQLHRISLANTSVHISLKHNDKLIFNLPVSNLKSRLSSLFGTHLAKKILSIGIDTDQVSIDGYISNPEHSKKRNRDQFLFVNGRYFRNPYLHKAIVSAYEGIISPDTSPSYFIRLVVDPKSVNVNIHPNKSEVKFEDEQLIWRLINSAVKGQLGKFNLAPSFDFEKRQEFELPSTPVEKSGGGYNPFLDVDTRRERVYNPYQEKGDGLKRAYSPDSMENINEIPPAIDFANLGVLEESKSESLMLFEEETTLGKECFQVDNRYIVHALNDDILIIDQHRASVRANFDKIDRDKLFNGNSTQLIFPDKISFDGDALKFIEGNLTQLKSIGYDIIIKESSSIEISSIPTVVVDGNYQGLLKQSIDIAIESDQNIVNTLCSLLASSLSRSRAIKSGDKLNKKEMIDLLSDLFSSDSPSVTNDGKKIFKRITKKDILTYFK